ncbi:hypothetical protein QCA50_010963 [Cerrena zonata]|uniref:Uncharacterized protein n=1 Tax=Cerrena zonata TaxID=2478898 RepID=A0AAW0FYU2_9APHY
MSTDIHELRKSVASLKLNVDTMASQGSSNYAIMSHIQGIANAIVEHTANIARAQTRLDAYEEEMWSLFALVHKKLNTLVEDTGLLHRMIEDKAKKEKALKAMHLRNSIIRGRVLKGPTGPLPGGFDMVKSILAAGENTINALGAHLGRVPGWDEDLTLQNRKDLTLVYLIKGYEKKLGF